MNELDKAAREREIKVCPYEFRCSVSNECYLCQWGGASKQIRFAANESFVLGAQWQAKQSPWISVEERKPEYGESVFFIVQWTNHKEYLSGVYCVDGSMESGNRIFPQDSTLGSFTHWMPIPE